ncbi:hypothetical protein L6452_02640 [Arctium lappa]|uniref:Uncharacterized protein n=1 Tax=Arctium lappa TaxID=4217 RepID=A0ACB9FKZ2_ARCLA|nr:hypothetical protein L6452_02640 [Arctium lappa]
MDGIIKDLDNGVGGDTGGTSCGTSLVRRLAICGSFSGVAGVAVTIGFPARRSYDQEPPTTNQREEQVEEEPCRKETKEYYKRERACQERETDDDGEVVDMEVGVVLLDPSCDVGYRFRFRKSGTVGEFRSKVALGEAGVEGYGDVVDKCTKKW